MSAGWTQQMAMTQRTFFVTPLLNKMQSWLALLKMLNQNVASQMSETHSPVNFPCECNLPMCDSVLNANRTLQALSLSESTNNLLVFNAHSLPRVQSTALSLSQNRHP